MPSMIVTTGNEATEVLAYGTAVKLERTVE